MFFFSILNASNFDPYSHWLEVLPITEGGSTALLAINVKVKGYIPYTRVTCKACSRKWHVTERVFSTQAINAYVLKHYCQHWLKRVHGTVPSYLSHGKLLDDRRPQAILFCRVPVFVCIQRPKISRGDALHRFTWNLAQSRGTLVGLAVRNFTPIGARMVTRLQQSKISTVG